MKDSDERNPEYQRLPFNREERRTERNDMEERELDLTWKDYIALSIALLQTKFLPILLLMGIILIIAILLNLLP
ncbi:MAG: hypothetical protein GWN31_11015 [Candidatus Thorarchaeota archaeon]|nr:hypothetical protein [Candidatus Thorarchaeota archaeon]